MMLEEEDMYESLPPSTKASTHMMAGAMAGIMEHCVMYPVDCVKTRMQNLRPHAKANYRSMVHAFATIIKHEGIFRTIRGVNVVALGAGPSHALYFASYEKIKKELSKRPGQNPLANAIAGTVATVVHDAAMCPVDVVKQRMQVYTSPYSGVMECVRDIYRTEGLRAFYRSYTTQLTMNIPFQSIHFVTYEFSQELLNPSREYNPRTHVISGAIAGAFAAAVTTPLDVCKTLLNTQESCVIARMESQPISGMFNAFRTVYQCCGFSGYFRGVQARVIYQMPSTALSWSVYEFFKYFISTHNRKQ
ncbi:mitoferrin-2-like [Ptychodera flava]|uniref:mitoferrin-2-like n=1 Tax=Ptychodera flava TaxID=63121 RepID=UPI00396A3AE4